VNNLEYSKFVAGEERPGERRPLPCPSPSSGRRYGDIPSAVSTLTVPLFFFFETGVLRKLEAFREKLKAVLHAAGHQTLHPLLQTRLMLHFVDRLDSSTLNVFKATPAKPTYQPSPTLPPSLHREGVTGWWAYPHAQPGAPSAAWPFTALPSSKYFPHLRESVEGPALGVFRERQRSKQVYPPSP
jgi:hypothetical protein